VSLYERFELLDLDRDDGVKTFEGREISTGRPVKVHLFVHADAPIQVALLKAINRLPDSERSRIIERGKQKKETLHGWLWLRLPDYLPVRITMITSRRDGKHEIRDEAEVDYTDSQKALLPTEVIHRRYEDDSLTAEDDFQYSNWQLIAAQVGRVWSPSH